MQIHLCNSILKFNSIQFYLNNTNSEQQLLQGSVYSKDSTVLERHPNSYQTVSMYISFTTILCLKNSEFHVTFLQLAWCVMALCLL